MQIYTNLKSLPKWENLAVTTGTFDGIHKGHQSLLQELKRQEEHLVITYSNHPLEILTKQRVLLLTSLEQKLQLFQEQKIKAVCVLSFDEILANTSYVDFLSILYHKGMSLLILGKGATLGHKKQGTETAIQHLGNELGFRAQFLQKKTMEQAIISTTAIKSAIMSGNLSLAEGMLGRSFCIDLTHIKQIIKPLQGRYSVQVHNKVLEISIENGQIIEPILPQTGKLIFIDRLPDKSPQASLFSSLKVNESETKAIQ